MLDNYFGNFEANFLDHTARVALLIVGPSFWAISHILPQSFPLLGSILPYCKPNSIKPRDRSGGGE